MRGKSCIAYKLCYPIVARPGSIEVAHRPNEFLPIAEFVRAGELLDDIVHRRCLAP
jgi:acetylornithine deacetylase/succinyl-diaminopimelate desuccinylase-like protein